jgi:hypothetical protein
VPEERSDDERLEADAAGRRGRLDRVEQDAAAARVLAGGADRDVADIRVELREFREHNNRVLNAMREDLTDIRERLVQVDGRFVQVDGRLDRLEQNVVGIRGVLDAQAAGQQQIIALLDGISRGQGDDRSGQ